MIKSLFSSLVLASNLNTVDRLAKGEIADAAKLTILIILKIIGKHFNVQQLTFSEIHFAATSVPELKLFMGNYLYKI